MNFLWNYVDTDPDRLKQIEDDISEMLGMGGYKHESRYSQSGNNYILSIYAEIGERAIVRGGCGEYSCGEGLRQ